MPISPHEQDLIRSSFDKLRKDFDTNSTYFYDAFFGYAPDLRRMFRDDLTGQGMKFMTTLGEVIDHLRNPNEDGEAMSELGHMHASIGIAKENFEPMEEALMDTFRHVMGEDFDDELEKAWRRAYGEIASMMIRKGNIS